MVFFFIFIRSVVRLLTLVSDSLRLRSVSFPLQNSVHMRILGFRRWVIFELLIYVVFGYWENWGKKGKEKERKRKELFFKFLFVWWCWGCRFNSGDSLGKGYGCVVFQVEKEYDGFGDWIDFLFVFLAFRRSQSHLKWMSVMEVKWSIWVILPSILVKQGFLWTKGEFACIEKYPFEIPWIGCGSELHS